MNDELRAVREQLVADNRQRLERLAADGVQVDLRAGLLQHLIDAVFPEGCDEREEFLVSWERRVAGELEAVETEVRRRRLLAGVNGSPPLS